MVSLSLAVLILLAQLAPLPSIDLSRRQLEIGIGDRYLSYQNGQRIIWYKQAERDGLRFRYFQMWLTKQWQDAWVGGQAALQRMADDGYTPVITYYYFGGSISKEAVEADLLDWYQDCQRLHRLLDIDREILVLIEPEFNVAAPRGSTSIYNWSGWNEAVRGAIARIRGASSRIKVGLCPGDFGRFNLDKCMKDVAGDCDFLAFQELRGSSHPHSSSQKYRDVASSAIDFAGYLQSRFRRPLLMCVGISSYTDKDPLGWSAEQCVAISGILSRLDALQQRGVFGLIYFEYFDDPQHDYSFFGEAERHFGLKNGQGAPKPAWELWRRAGEAIYARQ